MERTDLSAEALSYLIAARDGAFAFDELRRLSSDPERPDLTDTERTLVRRAESLSDLAVGAFGRDALAVTTVYVRGLSRHHRAAVLRNRGVSASGWGGTILSLAQAQTLLSDAVPELLQALFSNSRISPDGLLNVWERTGPAAALPDEAWPTIFAALSENHAIGDLFDTSRTLVDWSARARMHEALLDRLLQLTPTANLAVSLSAFLSQWNDLRSPASCYTTPRAEALIQHWHPAASCEANDSPFFKVVMLLTVLYGTKPAEYSYHPFAAARAAAMAMEPIGSCRDLLRLQRHNAKAFSAGMPFNRALYDSRMIGSAFADMVVNRDEAALAIYLQRRELIDQLGGADEPIKKRDLDRLYEINATRAPEFNQPISARDVASLSPSMLRDGAWQHVLMRKVEAWSPMWRTWSLRLALIIALLIVLQVLDIQLLKAHFSFGK